MNTIARLTADQRPRILEAAIPVFAGAGFPGASIGTVGRAAGANSALISCYFDDKQTVFFEVVRHVHSLLSFLRA